MHRQDLERMTTDRLLRLRSYARFELVSTPSFLYPLLSASLERRLDAINDELDGRHVAALGRVTLRPGYDASGPLEDALEPHQRPERG